MSTKHRAPDRGPRPSREGITVVWSGNSSGNFRQWPDRGPIPSRQQGPKVGTEVYARPSPFPTPDASGRTPGHPPRPRRVRSPAPDVRVGPVGRARDVESTRFGVAAAGGAWFRRASPCRRPMDRRARASAPIRAPQRARSCPECCFLHKCGFVAAFEARGRGAARRMHRCMMPGARQPATAPRAAHFGLRAALTTGWEA